MKIKLLIIIVLSPLLSSCNDLLNYKEISDYSKEAAFDTYDRAFQTATYVYSFLQGDFLSDNSNNPLNGASRSAGCDEAEYIWPWSPVHTFYDGTWTATKTVDDQWAHYYAGIRAANIFLENGVGLTFPNERFGTDYASRMRLYNNLQWEVRFLRAYYYFELVKRYNNIPLVEKVLTEEEANNVEQTSFENIVEYIVNECDTTIKYLPRIYNQDYSNQTGRITKAASMALKSRALLYAASKLHNPEHTTQKWIKAAVASKQLIDSMTVFGVPSLSQFATVTSPDNHTCPEIILGARCAYSNQPEATNFPIGFEGGNTGNCPTQNLAECFGVKRTKVFDPANPFSTDRDTRLLLTMVTNGSIFCYNDTIDISEGSPSGQPSNGATKTGYYLKKFLNKDVSITKASTTTSSHTFPIFRYAEVFLNYAEAMNEIYSDFNHVEPGLGLNISALSALNKIRGRAGLGLAVYATSDFSTNDDFVTALRKERMAELAFEDHRFWDIRRWMIGPQTTVIKRLKITKNPTTGKYIYSVYETNNRIWDDKMYFYPIPQTEIFKNKKLVQNAGW